MVSENSNALRARKAEALAKMQENRAAIDAAREELVTASVEGKGQDAVTVDVAVELLEKAE